MDKQPNQDRLAQAMPLFVLPVLIVALLAWRGYASWHGWLIGTAHSAVSALLGGLWGAWLGFGAPDRSRWMRERVRVFILGALTILVWTLLYRLRPLPPASFDNGMWRVLMLTGFMSGGIAGMALARRRQRL